MDGQEAMLRDALADFLRRQSAEESISGIDEIVLSYMVSILEVLGSDAAGEEAFDLDSFIEMMDAYLPGFSDINSAEVCEWVFDLANRLQQFDQAVKTENPVTCSQPQLINGSKDKAVSVLPTFAPLQDKEGTSYQTNQYQQPRQPPAPRQHPPRQPKPAGGRSGGRRSRRSSEKTEAAAAAERGGGGGAVVSETQNGYHDNSAGVELLLEMFPSSCSLEVSHCLEVSHGDLEAATQLILLRQEAGESFSMTPPKPHQVSAKKTDLSYQEDSKLKKSIINKYSYVDVDEAKKEHRPVMPKYEGKKLTRYLENKVVSTKGEKFTEIKNGEEEEQKKRTTVSLKPAKQYRFH